MSLRLREISSLLIDLGQNQYGLEAVSQLEHALQCAYIAELENETPSTIVAALLHDLGHLIALSGHCPAENHTSKDDLHQYIAIPFLRGVFSDAVLEPIRLHVDAKRYLCAADENYWSTLSSASKYSLEQQGGIFSIGQAKEFLTQPYSEEAIRLRLYDDQAKVAGLETPDLAHFQTYVREVTLQT